MFVMILLCVCEQMSKQQNSHAEREMSTTMKVKRTDEWMDVRTDGMARDRLDLTI